MAGGRPTKYKPEFAKIAEQMCNLGATDPQLAEAFDVTISTITLWKVTYPEFSAAIKISKDNADNLVEQSLYKRALGYECEEIDIRVIEGQIVETKVKKVYPPDPTAMIFWLKNRQKEKWRDKQEVQHSGSILTEMTDEQLEAAIKAKQEKLNESK